MRSQCCSVAALVLASAAALIGWASADDGVTMPLGRPTPPYPARGWDSYDAFDLDGLTEERVYKTVEALTTIPSGDFRYIVLDEGWAEFIGKGNNRNGWLLDEYCRPKPNPATFPGSKGTSFAYLSQYMRDRGLSLGLWHMKGIPESALRTNCTIKGSNGKYTARDVAVPGKKCPWHDQILWADSSREATKLYFKSIAELFREWGVEYIKIDCVFGERDWDTDSMVGFSKALSDVYPPGTMVYSVSPGVKANPRRLPDVAKYLSSYRITDDLWDHWGPEGDQAPSGINVLSVTRALVDFNQHAGLDGFGGGKAYADGDMLPFGLMRLGGEHLSRISAIEARYIYGLWSIALSPMILGGDMTSMAQLPWLRDLITNQGLKEVSTQGTKPRVIQWKEPQVARPGHSVWVNDRKDRAGERHLGIFPYNTRKGTSDVVKIKVPIADLRLPAGTRTVTFVDLVQRTPNTTLTLDTDGMSFEVPSRTNDGNVFLVVPSPECCQPNVQPVRQGGQQDANAASDQQPATTTAGAAGDHLDGLMPHRVFPHVNVDQLRHAIDEQHKLDALHVADDHDHRRHGGGADFAHRRGGGSASNVGGSPLTTYVEGLLILMVVAVAAFLLRRRRRGPGHGVRRR